MKVPMRPHVQVGLQSLDLPRERRLAKIQAGGGPSDAASGETSMRIKPVLLALLCAVALPLPLAAQDKLGNVTFPISCDPKAQAQFERGVAMLHSYWFSEARKV